MRRQKKSTKEVRQSRRRRGSRPVRTPARARRFTASQKAEALALVGKGLAKQEVARIVRTTTESLRMWEKEAGANRALKAAPAQREVATGDAAPPPVSQESTAPGPVLDRPGLSPVEEEAILGLKKEQPSMGPAQIRAQLKRFRGWRLSVKAIAGVLKRHGYRVVHKGSRPEGQEHPGRFEAPRRNAIWQMDFAELRVGAERLFLLFVLDDYSRFIVGHTLAPEPTSEVAVETLKAALAVHGKPESVYTDRGGAFLAWRDPSAFRKYLEAELIDHHVSRPYRPQGRGKVEALIGTVQRELWQVRQFESVVEAKAALRAWVEHYNERRAHMGLDGLTPADRYFGRAEAVRARIAARVRGRALAAGASDDANAPVEEPTGDPLEVLRLVIADGQAELRLFGARIPLGAVVK